MDCFDNIYKDRTVLVTGHTGFKGSWLSIWLKELGAKVIGYSSDEYADEGIFKLGELKKHVTDVRGDIRDIKKLSRVFDTFKPEIIFHLAAQPLVRLSYEIPRETYEVNVMGTLNILECIRKSNSVKAGIIITTDKCYENKEQIWGYRETDSMGGFDPYSSSKGCAELLIASYRNSFFNPEKYDLHKKVISSVRAGNVIGGGDWAEDRIIPDCIRSLKNNKSIEIRNPMAIRPWQHVLEPLSGYLWLGAKMIEDGIRYSGSWNFGPDDESIITVKEVADLVIDNWGKGNWLDLSERNRQAVHEANLLRLDCTKSKVFLKWKPVLTIDRAIHLTVEWYKNYIGTDVYKLCKSQITTYINKAVSKGIHWAAQTSEDYIYNTEKQIAVSKE